MSFIITRNVKFCYGTPKMQGGRCHTIIPVLCTSNASWWCAVLQILRCSAPGIQMVFRASTNISVHCTWMALYNWFTFTTIEFLSYNEFTFNTIELFIPDHRLQRSQIFVETGTRHDHEVQSTAILIR